MKTIMLNCLLLLLIAPATALAGNIDYRVTKEKKISKTYIVNSTCALDVDNQYGSIYVTTWDEDKVSIDVVIKVSADKEEQVDRRLSSIDVDFDATKSLVAAKTRIGNCSGCNFHMEINYTIKVPKKGSILLDNQYGNTIVGKIYGKADIECQYGDLTVDELNNETNIIKLQYSGASRINYMKSGDVNAQYSQFHLTKGNILRIRNQYTGVYINEIDNLNYNAAYGDINIKTAGKVTGVSEYTGTRFKNVTDLLNLTTSYGDISVENIGKGVRNVAINSSYTGIRLGYGAGYPFDFEINGEYTGIRGTGDFKFTERTDKDNKSRFRGYYKSSGTNRIFIKAEYGHIEFDKV